MLHIAPRPFNQRIHRWRQYTPFSPIGYSIFIRGKSYYLPHRRRLGGELAKVFATWR
jgi:hypothetical protein